MIAETISSNAVSTVLNSLTLMLYLLVPWTATNLVDFFLVRHGRYAIADLFTPHGLYGAWGWRGLAVSGIAYWLFSRSLNVRDEAGAIRASDEALEATV